MAGSKAPSGSLRAHASSAEKARSSGVFGNYKPAAPRFKKNEFVGDDSGSSSSGSDSDSDSDDSDIPKEAASDFKKRISQTPSSKDKATPVKATPAKSPTVNGLTASVKKNVAGTKVKKEETSSSSASSESGSDDESSSDEEDTKASAKGKQAKQTKEVKSQPKPESSDESETSSESESDHAKKPKAKADKKPAAKPKANAKPIKKEETTSESESSSEESESESASEDAEVQIAQQFTNDVQSAKTAKAQVPASIEGTSKSKSKAKAAKAAKSPIPEEEDNSDVEMVDQSTALTNGGSPTKVGSVPEFVAPDFHLRKLDGNIDATDVAGFFEKAKMDGKQVWYITAPASLPVTVVQDLTIPMDQAQKGLPVLSHNGDDYRMAFDNPAASSSFRLLIPNKNGDEYSMLERPVNQTMHFTRSETFPADGPASIVTTQTVATTKPARPQPEGLKARYTPLGVPSPKPTLAPPANSKKRNAASQETAATSSKKKRKHANDGENGPAATTPTQKETPSKKTNAETPAKKQKTSKNVQEKAPVAQSGHKETPVPLPPQVNGGASAKKPRATKPKAPPVPSASQPAPASRRSASPGAALPSTQIPAKQTPVPIPFPKPAHVVDLTRPASSSDAKKERRKRGRKEERPEATPARPEKGSFDEALENIRTPKRVTPIPPPRFGSK